MQELAKKIAKDGEGANKLIQVDEMCIRDRLDGKRTYITETTATVPESQVAGERCV